MKLLLMGKDGILQRVVKKVKQAMKLERKYPRLIGENKL